MASFEDYINNYNKELVSKAKKREDLIVPVKCLVKCVIGYNTKISISPVTPNTVGCRQAEYRTGNCSSLEIEVKTNTVIEKLLFNGWPPIENGNKIVAYIIKGREEYKKDLMGIPIKNEKSFFVEREFDETEIPLKIQKVGYWGVLATYINYEAHIGKMLL